MKNHGWLAFSGIALFTVGCLAAGMGEDYTLVQAGKSCATIVIAEDASNIAKLAAEELQYHIEKITGTQVPMVTDKGNVTGLTILVGTSRLTDALKLPVTPFKDQEYLIHFAKDAIVLMGKDDETFKPQFDYRRAEGFPTIFTAQGTMYATYDFLERFCEVRWYLPTELGVTFTPRSTLTVSGNNVQRIPYMKTRDVSASHGYPEDLIGTFIRGTTPVPRLSRREHMLYLYRHRMGGEERAVNHSFHGYRLRFWEQHPLYRDAFVEKKTNWFAKGYESQKQPPQLCYTNEELVEQVVRDARSYFDQTGYVSPSTARGDYFSVVPYDNSQFCKCATCQALIEQGDYRGKGSFSNGMAAELVFSFVNKVACEIKKSHPNKWIATLGYMSYGYPPLKEKLEDNVDITLCMGTSAWWHKASRANEEKTLSVWKETGNPLSLWLYYFGDTFSGVRTQYRAFPPLFGRKIPEQIKLFCDSNVQSMKYEPVYLAAGPQGLQQSALMGQVEFFMTWRLADNPDLDGMQLFDDFFARYYGAAEEPMKQFYTRVEDIYWDEKNHPKGVRGSELNWKYLGTEERLKELETYMDRAKDLVQTDLEKKRVALFEEGIWNYMQTAHAAYWKYANVPMPTARVPKVTAAKADIKELDWEKAGILSGWKANSGADHPAMRNQDLEARLLYDERNLYIRLVDKGIPEEMRDTGGIWDSDEYEIFFTPARGPNYMQIGIDWKGRHAALQWGENKGELSWKEEVQYAGTVTKDTWTQYVAIPLKHVLGQSTERPDTIYLNIIRSMKMGDACAWCPTLGTYHEPGRFAEVVLEK